MGGALIVGADGARGVFEDVGTGEKAIPGPEDAHLPAPLPRLCDCTFFDQTESGGGVARGVEGLVGIPGGKRTRAGGELA